MVVSISEYAYDLAVDIGGESYYVVSKISDADPMEVNLTHDGEPLSAQAMENAELTLDAGDWDCSGWTVEKDAENSRFLVYPTADKSDTGTHKVTATVTSTDEVGNAVEAQDTQRVELQNYPRWLRILFWILVIALIVFIIVKILRQKVLPKHITVAKSTFVVDGDEVTGRAVLTGYKGNRKTASLTIASPKNMNNPMAKCSINLSLEAVDPRMKKSSTRAAMVKRATVSPAHNIESYKIATATFNKDPDSASKFIRSGSHARKAEDGKNVKKGKGAQDDSLDIRLTSNQRCSVSGTVMDGSSMGADMNFSVTLKFI